MILRIKVGFTLVISFFLSNVAIAQSLDSLKLADSLFSEYQYTQAMLIYESFFENETVSPSMLLKMAFIEDGSGNYEEALFYLDTYYSKSADREVIPKIEELAEEHDLIGYKYDDTHYFSALLSKYRVNFSIGLIILSIVFMVYILKKRKEGEKPYAASIIQVFLMVCLFGLVNFTTSQKGLIISDQTLLRSGPSAGAEPVQMIKKGHKVTILKESDVWTKILWEGDEVFVRKNRLRAI